MSANELDELYDWLWKRLNSEPAIYTFELRCNFGPHEPIQFGEEFAETVREHLSMDDPDRFRFVGVIKDAERVPSDPESQG